MKLLSCFYNIYKLIVINAIVIITTVMKYNNSVIVLFTLQNHTQTQSGI